MEQDYKIRSNGECVWMEIPEDEKWNIDVNLANRNLQDVVAEEPAVMDLIEAFGCDIVVDTNHEYYPFSNQNVD